MAFQFELDNELQAAVTDLAADLQHAAQEARDAFEERSEQWREGDDGMATDAWIEVIGEAADALENLPAKPE